VNQLFIELDLDEDVDVLIADLLHVRGFVALTARDAGQLHKSDAEQLAYAVSQHKVLLPHNRADFEALAQTYFAAGQSHSGIIIAVRRLPHAIVHRLLQMLNHVTADEMNDQVRYI